MASNSLAKKLVLKDSTGFLTERAPIKLYLLAMLIGALASAASIGFIYLYEILRRWIYISKAVDFATISANTPSWYFFLLFIGGGGLIGLFIYYIIPFHGHGHGMPHLLYRFKHMQYITPQEGVSATAASAVSLGMGASVGREGPIMFLGGAITSWLCQIFGLQGHYYRVLLSTAIASSLSTSLHSSFVGIFFVLEIISFSITTIDLLPIALGIFIGAAIREIFPSILKPVFFHLQVQTDYTHVPYFIVLGIISGLLAIAFSQSLKFTISSHFHSELPKWIWPVFGGVGLAFLAIYIPDVMGIGFDRVPLNETIQKLSFKFMLIFLLAKLVATYLSLGFGFSGGIISPIFVAGMLLGILYGTALQDLFPNSGVTYHIFALAGTAAFTAAVIGAPLTLTMLAFEVSLNINMALNTFVAVFFAVLVMKAFRVKSFFQDQYLFLYAD